MPVLEQTETEILRKSVDDFLTGKTTLLSVTIEDFSHDDSHSDGHTDGHLDGHDDGHSDSAC